jgi:hypothetical protein
MNASEDCDQCIQKESKIINEKKIRHCDSVEILLLKMTDEQSTDILLTLKE